MTSLKFIASVVIFAVLAAFLGIASAAGPHFPRVVVQSKGEQVAKMHTWGYDWYYKSGGRVHHIEGGDPPPPAKMHWPKKGRVDTGAKVWVKFMRPDKPGTVELDSYTKIDKHDGYPKGEVTVLDRSKFYPVRSANGKIKGWKTYFYTEEAPRDYYIIAIIEYERDPALHSYGWVNDTVHLRTK